MPSNVEIKASVSDPSQLVQLVEHISGSQGTVIVQEDVFFNCPNGRLKLRKLQGEDAQLIFYSRSDDSGPKFSDYDITRTADPEGLQTTLGKALGIKGIVKKRRVLYMVGQTRVHVDEVEGLGHFMELEVVMKDGQSVTEGQTIADNLMKQLQINQDSLISCAYMDLILKQNKQINT